MELLVGLWPMMESLWPLFLQFFAKLHCCITYSPVRLSVSLQTIFLPFGPFFYNHVLSVVYCPLSFCSFYSFCLFCSFFHLLISLILLNLLIFLFILILLILFILLNLLNLLNFYHFYHFANFSVG